MRRRREGRRVFFLPRRDKQKPGAGSPPPPPGLMRTWMRCRGLTGVAKKVPAAKQLAARAYCEVLAEVKSGTAKMRRRTFAPLSDR